MLKEIIVASTNQGKISEFASMLGDIGISVKSLADFDNIPDIIEDGSSFEENAKIKVETIKDITGLPVIADDSGLMVDYLDGEPGIYSARFAGEEKDDMKNNEKLLRLLKGVAFENRKAAFVSAIALAIPNEETVVVRGVCEGYIACVLKGTNGFGYDPLFYLSEYDKTMAELDQEIKNKISHRYKALKEIVGLLDYRL